jgi:hypothetical protein
LFYLKAIQHGGERAEERIRRAATAQNLREEGTISWEEANNYIITGQLFVPRDRAADRSLADAYRQKWFQLGHEFQQHVLETRLKRLYDLGLIEVEERYATMEGKIRRPDYARKNPLVPGENLWIGDAKLGRMDKDQMLAFIDEASRTTRKLLILFTPEATVIPRWVYEEAAKAGVKVINIQLPYMPEGGVPKLPNKNPGAQGTSDAKVGAGAKGPRGK